MQKSKMKSIEKFALMPFDTYLHLTKQTHTGVLPKDDRKVSGFNPIQKGTEEGNNVAEIAVNNTQVGGSSKGPPPGLPAGRQIDPREIDERGSVESETGEGWLAHWREI
jgi:hypothetical protein